MEQMLKALVNVRTYMFIESLVCTLNSIKPLTGYYLMSFSYYIVISGYKYTEYIITTLTQYNVIILIVSHNSFLFFLTKSVPNNL